MNRFPAAAFAVAALFFGPSPAAPVPAGGKSKDVTELPVGADSLAVIQLNGLDRTKGRILKMLEPIDPALAKSAAEWYDTQLNELLDGRDLKGIDPGGRVFLAVGPFAELADDEPPVCVAVPVPDYKTFRNKVLTESERRTFIPGNDGVDEFEAEDGGKTLYLVDTKGGYVIVTPSKKVGEQYAARFDHLTAAKLGSVADSFLAADAAIYLNVSRVNELYEDQIRQGKAFFDLVFQQGAAGLDPAQLQAARTVIDGAFRVIADASGLVLALEARPEGANARLDLSFLPDSPSAKVVGAEKPDPLAALNTLPKGMTTYTASRWGKAFSDLQRSLGGEFSAADGDAQLTEAIEKHAELLASPDGATVTISGPELSSLTATAFQEPAAVTAAMLTLMNKMTGGARYSNIVLKQKPVVKEASQTHAGFTLSSAAIEVDYEAAVRELPDEATKEAAIEAMKKLVPEKQTIWFGHDTKRFVRIAAKDWATAKALLDGFANPSAKVGDVPAFAATRKQLPGQASYVTLFDTAGFLDLASAYLQGMGGAIPGPGLEVPKLGQVKGDPTYVGVAFAAQPLSARLDVFIPAGAIRVIRTAIAQGGARDED